MQKTISSKLTFFMKFILPLLWFLSFFNLLRFIFTDQPQPPELPKEFIIFFWVFGWFIIYWFYFRLKKVSVFGEFFYVSNFLKEIKIPITDVEKITENVFVNHHPITIHLTEKSEFGRKIVFMPTFRLFAFFSSHPITEELRGLVRSKKSAWDSNYRY